MLHAFWFINARPIIHSILCCHWLIFTFTNMSKSVKNCLKKSAPILKWPLQKWHLNNWNYVVLFWSFWHEQIGRNLRFSHCEKKKPSLKICRPSVRHFEKCEQYYLNYLFCLVGHFKCGFVTDAPTSHIHFAMCHCGSHAESQNPRHWCTLGLWNFKNARSSVRCFSSVAWSGGQSTSSIAVNLRKSSATL